MVLWPIYLYKTKTIKKTKNIKNREKGRVLFAELSFLPQTFPLIVFSNLSGTKTWTRNHPLLNQETKQNMNQSWGIERNRWFPRERRKRRRAMCGSWVACDEKRWHRLRSCRLHVVHTCSVRTTRGVGDRDSRWRFVEDGWGGRVELDDSRREVRWRACFVTWSFFLLFFLDLLTFVIVEIWMILFWFGFMEWIYMWIVYGIWLSFVSCWRFMVCMMCYCLMLWIDLGVF